MESEWAYLGSIDGIMSAGLDFELPEVEKLLSTYWALIYEVTNRELIIELSSPKDSFFKTCAECLAMPVVFRNQQTEAFKPDESKQQEIKMYQGILLSLELVLMYNCILIDIFQFEKEIPQYLLHFYPVLAKLLRDIYRFSQAAMAIREHFFHQIMGLKQSNDVPIAFLTFELCEALQNFLSEKHQHKSLNLKVYLEDFTKNFVVMDMQVVLHIAGFVLGPCKWFSLRTHEVPISFVCQQYVLKILASLRPNLVSNDAGSDPRSFLALGMTLVRANTLTQNVCFDFVQKESPVYWAVRYIRHVFQYHPLISYKDVPKFPFGRDIINQWFSIRFSRGNNKDLKDTDQVSVCLKILNKSNTEGLHPLALNIQMFSKPGHVFMYHGTTHRGALCILDKGIDLTKGQQCQDFSSGDGFYLTQDFFNAFHWAEEGRGQRYIAVVVFQVESSMLDPQKEKGLDLRNDHVDHRHKKWEKVVTICRTQYGNLGNYKDQLFPGVNFIVGPTCSNPFQVVAGQPAVEQPCGINTWCLRGKDYANRFGSLENIFGVVFF